MRRTMILLLAMFVALGILTVSSISVGETQMAAQKAEKEFRSSGTIERSSPDKSMLVVKEHSSKIDRVVFYNDSTKWTKGKASADMKEFKDGSRVICLGKLNDKGELTATRIDLQK